MMRLPALAIASLAGTLAVTPAVHAQDAVDVSLVLAVDVSWSMDADEKQIQRDGYVAAFRDRDVIQAIREGGWGAIAVTYVEWAGTGLGQVLVPWRRIHDGASANGFADELAAAPIGRLTRTSISSAMDISWRLLDDSPFKAVRRVVDISGDGPNNQGPAVDETRDLLVSQGITINGLPVVFKRHNPSGFPSVENLDVYYEDCVIGGTGAFIVPVTDTSQFAAAIRRKLLLEIAAAEPQVVPAQEERRTGGTDCLIGEKMWQMWRQRIDWQ